MLRASLTAGLIAGAFWSTSRAAKAGDYRGPIIDIHAHIRLTEADVAATANHRVGTAELKALDGAAGIVSIAIIVMAARQAD